MANRKKQESVEVEGLALVDIYQVNAKSGEWVSLPADLAKSLEDAGAFDPKAQKPK